MKSQISKRLKQTLSCLVAFSVLLTTIFTAVTVATALEPMYWDGNIATEFAGGDGTKDNPYLIENGGQLAKAVKDKGLKNGASAYYSIKNDIFLNEDYANYKNWGTTAPKNNWGITYNNSAFAGYIDGGYHTVYGMYYNASGSYAGLVAYLSGNGATICNLIIANSYVNNSAANTTALFAGRIDNGTISNCIARDSYLTNKDNKTMAGIAAWSNANTTKITNCGAYGLSFSSTNIIGGILAQSNNGNATVSKCFSGGTYIFGNTSNIACSNSFTDVSASWKNGVTNWSATPEKMQGAEAVANMGLSTDIWTSTDGYPTFVLSSNDQEDDNDEDEEIDSDVVCWDGNAATEFAGGDGTKENPYLIENANQLYKAVIDLGKTADGKAAYYLITDDIYINNTYKNYANWENKAPKNNWLPTHADFIGHIDGDFHTVYGLYSVTGAWRNGLIPIMNSGATVSNLIIANSYVKNNDSVAGAIVGSMGNNTKVSGCLVYDTIVSAKNQDVGGIAGVAAKNTVTISDCGTYNLTISGKYAGGILGRPYQVISGANGTRVLNCFSVDNFPLGYMDQIWASECYTNAQGSKSGITIIDKEKMIGVDAVNNMKLSDILWKSTESYPVIYKYSDEYEIWDGSVATEFAGGSGNATDPYLIENGAQLYKAINDLGKNTDGTAAYYLITNDIYLNRLYENYSYWGDRAPKNNWNPTRGDFIGYIDGDFHTIYGLYSSIGYWRNGLIPYMNSGATVSNLIITKSYINNNDSTAGAITGAMYDNTKISGCLVYDTVVSVKNQDVGGIAGIAAKNTVTISDCGTYNLTLNGANAGGILGRAYQSISGANGTRILKCFSVDNFPLGNTDKIWVSGSYTNAEGTKGGISKIEKEQMQGKDAVNNMSLTKAIWTATDSYPTLSGIKEVKGDVWSGISAMRFAGGNGTESDPYIIETASQLYKAVSDLGIGSNGKAAYYSVTSDIYLNEDYENYASWGENQPVNNWLPISGTVDFKGHIDGNGYTVYGLYVNKTAWCAGLVARVNGGSIRDINVAKSYIHGVDGTVGGIVGMAYEHTNISRCKVYDTVIVDESATDIGGIVGAAKTRVMITGCATYNIKPISEGTIGGILGRAWSGAQIRESYSIGNYPIGNIDTYRIGCSNVYTDSDKLVKDGIITLKTEDMKGKKALKNMPLISSIWQADDEGYPVYTEYNNGKNGEVWTGYLAENYAGGDGTEENPYLIETGEQLYKLVFENCIPGNVPKYYKVIANIRLNNTKGDKWYEKSNVNMWHLVSKYSFSFAGHLDGDGHTVAGIYTASESGNAYAGLIPVLNMGSYVKNIGVIESNITTSTSVAENFSGGIIGWIDNWDANNPVTEENIPVVSGCFADATVSLSGMYCGGIVSGVSAPVLVENCYYTGKFDSYATAACIIGNIWTPGSKISHCYAATSGMHTFAGGQSTLKSELEYEACYNFGKGSGTNFSFVSLYDIRGEKAVQTLSELDFDNIWRTVEGGTPVLKVFGEDADKFSSKDDVYSTVRFITNVAGMSLEPISGIIDSPIKLPTPKREGYEFAGWYVYSELQCEYTYDTFPFIDLILYAKWEPLCVAQDFENYPNTQYDLDDDYVYFRPGALGYDGGNVHGGNKAIKRLGNSSERQDFLVKYEKELTVGKEYTISFWMMTETKGASGKVSMLNATWPDIAEPILGDEITVASYKNLSVGEWKQYKYTFTATTPWVSLRTEGNTVLYFDDILIYPSK